MSSFLKIIGVSLCFLIFTFPPASSNVKIITQGLPPTRGIHASIGTLPNSNIILISTGEIDAYDDVWVNPDTEIDWYYYVDSSGMHFLGAECYTPMYFICPRLSLNVSENLVHFKSRTRLVRGIPENDFIIFDFGDRGYKVPVSEVLPYLWDESWIGHLSGYSFNGSLVFFPEIIIEITGAGAEYQGCVPGDGAASVRFEQHYNVTYYVKDSKTSWKRSPVKSEIIDQSQLLDLLERPIYVFSYNGTLKAFEAGRIRLKYSTVMVNENNMTRVFVTPRFYYSNMVSPLVPSNTTYLPAERTNVIFHRRGNHELCLLIGVLFVVTIICILCRNRKNR